MPEAAGYATTDLYDACEHDDGAAVQVLEPGLLGDYGGRARFHGEVVTLQTFADNSMVRELLACPGEGRVLVVHGGDSLHYALLGDMLATLGMNNGWSGAGIGGSGRETEVLATLECGVKARAASPHRSPKRGLGSRDVELHFGGVSFRPGAHLYADRDGLLLSPRPLHAA